MNNLNQPEEWKTCLHRSDLRGDLAQVIVEGARADSQTVRLFKEQ